jgi:hypothetical protein
MSKPSCGAPNNQTQVHPYLANPDVNVSDRAIIDNISCH